MIANRPMNINKSPGYYFQDFQGQRSGLSPLIEV